MAATTIEVPRDRKTAPKPHHPPGVLQSLKGLGEALVVAIFLQVTALLSPDRASSLGRRIFGALAPRLRRTRRVRANLRLALPEKSEAEIDELVQEVWGSAGRLFAEYAHLRTICGKDRDERIEVVLDWDIEAYRRAGKPVVFVTAHMANWELTAATAVALGVPLTVVYTPLTNPFIDRVLQRKRRSVGCNFVAKKAASRRLLRDLQNGTSVGLLVDQVVHDGEPVTFFGRDALTSTTPARLALKFDCDLVPVEVERTGGARFRVTFHQPIKPGDAADDTQTRALQMTRAINEIFETWIRKRPEQWICWKGRWPRKAKRKRR